MDIQQALLNRQTIHTYSTDPISSEAMTDALQAAVCAPNHRLTFPWRFTQVGAQTRARLADLSVSLQERGASDPLSPRVIESIRSKVLDPAELVVPSLVKHEDAFTAREDYAAVSCAIQNLMLSLTGHGIGTKWSTGKITTQPETYQLLGINPLQEEIVGFIWVGLPNGGQKRPARPPLEDFVRQLP